MPYNKKGEALPSKDPRHYRVRVNGKIVSYGHTPEEARDKAFGMGFNTEPDVSYILKDSHGHRISEYNNIHDLMNATHFDPEVRKRITVGKDKNLFGF